MNLRARRGRQSLNIYVRFTAPPVAHNSTKDVRTLLQTYGNSDAVNIEFSKFRDGREVHSLLLNHVNYQDRIVDVIGPVTVENDLPSIL